MYEVSWRTLDGRTSCAAAVSAAVVDAASEAIRLRGRAVVALSGGSTPRPMLSRLAEAQLDWTRVIVTLVDERWCDHEDDSSNFKMVSALLGPAVAAGATLRPLWRSGCTPQEAAEAASRELRGVSPLDLVVLGMGTDAHTASWIPEAEGLEAALADVGPEVRALSPSDGRHLRLTITRPVVAAARRRILHITGSEKRAVLEASLAGAGDWTRVPVRAALSCGTVTVYHGGDSP